MRRTGLVLGLLVALVMMPTRLIAQSLNELMQQVGVAESTGNYIEVENIMRKGIQIYPNEARFYYGLGIALQRTGKLKEAISAFRQAIKLQPDNAPAYNNLGIALSDQKKLEEAISAFRQSIKLQPDNARAYNNLGTALSNQKKLEEAISAFRQAIKLQPNYASAYYNLGTALGKQGKLEETISAYRQAIKLRPDLAAAYYGLGIALGEQGQSEEAITAYRQAITFNPNDASIYYNLGTVLLEQNKLEEAITTYRQAIKLQPDYADAYVNMGIALSKQKKLEEAISAFRQAIKFNPNDASNYYNFGNALYDQNKLEEAITAYRQAIKLQPNYADAYTNMGVALGLKGELEEAIINYRKAIQINPNNVNAQNGLKEAQRLLALNSSRPNITDDSAYLPSINEEPLLPQLRSTVRVISSTSQGVTVGTGWVIKRSANSVWIVTNRHVITDSQRQSPSTKIEAEFFSDLSDEQRPRYTAILEKVTTKNDDIDLAVLRVDHVPDDIQPLPTHFGRVARSSGVTIIGHPFNVSTPWAVVTGKVMNYSPQDSFLTLDATLAAGNSGSPVLNEKGEVIALLVAVRTTGEVMIDPDIRTQLLETQPSTGGVGLAYRIDIIMDKLKEWNIIP